MYTVYSFVGNPECGQALKSFDHFQAALLYMPIAIIHYTYDMFCNDFPDELCDMKEDESDA